MTSRARNDERFLRALAGSGTMRVWGSSMMPLIWPGARIAFDIAGDSQLYEGALVVRLLHGRMVVHRAERSGRGWVTRGDASGQPDPPIGPGEAFGVVPGLVVGPLHWAATPTWLVGAVRAQLPRRRGAVQRAYRRSVPAVRQALRAAGRGWGPLARWVGGVHYGPLGAAHAEPLRRYLVRAGRRPTARRMDEWLRAGRAARAWAAHSRGEVIATARVDEAGRLTVHALRPWRWLGIPEGLRACVGRWVAEGRRGNDVPPHIHVE